MSLKIIVTFTLVQWNYTMSQKKQAYILCLVPLATIELNYHKIANL